MSSPSHVQLAIVGASWGGIATALTASRFGLSVALIDRAPVLADLPTCGTWTGGVGGTGIPFDIYRRLRQEHPDATTVCQQGTPTDATYADTLDLHAAHAVCFDSTAMRRTVSVMLSAAGCSSLRTSLSHAAMHGTGTTLTLESGAQITAEYLVDATDDLQLASLLSPMPIVPVHRLSWQQIHLGISDQIDSDIVSICNHAPGQTPLDRPYGVPYRCILTQDLPDLLLISPATGIWPQPAPTLPARVLMQLGQAAGTAVAIAAEHSVPLAKIPDGELRLRLFEQHVQVSHPLTKALRGYLLSE